MADIQLLLEAERRGILPPDKQALLTEARQRGLIEDSFTEPEQPKQEKPVGGFWDTFFEQMKTIPSLADEAAAFAANPTRENAQAFVAAGDSKFRNVGFGEGENWAAFKQLLGGSLGALVAPAAAATAASVATTPIGGIAAGMATSASQYEIQNLLRQAQEQERAIAEGRTPEELQLGKSLAASAAQAGLDYAGMRVFRETFRAFPFLRNLVSSEEEVAESAARKLVDGLRSGNLKSTGRGTVEGIVEGVAVEAPQEVAQQALERWQANLSLSDQEARDEYKQAMIGALVVGPAIGGAAGALGARADKNRAEVFKATVDTANARLQEITSKEAPTAEEQAEAKFISENIDNPVALSEKYKPKPPATSEEEMDEEQKAPPPPPKEIKTAEDLLNSPPKVTAENAPEAVRNEPVNLTDDQVYEEIGKMEDQQEQLATLLFDPVQIQAQAAAQNTPIEVFTANLTKAYDDLATRLDVFHNNFMQRMDPATAALATSPKPPVAPAVEVATEPSVATEGAAPPLTLTSPPSAEAPAPAAPTAPDVRTLALDAIKVTPTIKAISEATGLNQPKAAQIMNGFVDEGIVERYGKAGNRFRLVAPKAAETAAPEVAAPEAPPTTTPETSSEPVPSRAGEVVSGAAGAGAELPVQRVAPAGREAAEPTSAGLEPAGVTAERPVERAEGVEPALARASASVLPEPERGVSTDESDISLVQRAQKGEAGAFDALMLRYRPKIVKFLMRYVRNNQADAEDIAQETFIKAYRALPGFQGDSAFYTWLYRIAANTAKNALVARARNPVQFGLDNGTEEQDVDISSLQNRMPDTATPEALTLTEEIRATVTSAIEQLPEDQRTAIVLRELEGMSYEEIAAAMGSPVGTVRSRIFRAKETIDARLREIFPGGLGRGVITSVWRAETDINEPLSPESSAAPTVQQAARGATKVTPEQKKALADRIATQVLADRQKKALADRVAAQLSAREGAPARKGPFGKAKGKIVVSDNLDQRFGRYLKNLVNLINLGNVNIILLNRGDINTPESLANTIDKYGLYDDFNLDFLSDLAARPDSFAGVQSFDSNEGYAIFIDTDLPIQATLENLAHEVGHILEVEVLSKADEKTQTAIIDDWQRWLENNNKEKTARLFKKARAYATAQSSLEGIPEDMVLDEGFRDYLTSFAEWFADNVAKWATTNEKPISLVEKFFASLAAKLRKLAAYMTGTRADFLPSQAVKAFLDGLGPVNDKMAGSMIKEAMGFKGPRPIFPSIEGIKNFWNWFGDSKVVDEDGHPIIMYHGSPKVFSVFRPGGRAKAIFLSPDPYFADRFTIDEFDYDVGPIYPVYVSAKNPFDYENFQHVAALEAELEGKINPDDMAYTMSNIKDGDWRTIENGVVQRAIKKLGHDGFYVMESLFSPELGDRVEAKNLAVYEPNQVKSATGNNGKFSKKMNDVNAVRRASAKTLNNVGKAVSSLPKFNSKIYNGVRAALDSTRVTDAMRSAFYAFTSLPQHVQMFVKELPTLRELLNVLNVRASELKSRKEVLDRNVRKWNSIIRKHKQYKDEFYEVAHESTRLNGADGRQGIEFNNPINANHPLTQRFKRLPVALQNVYWEMLKSYRDMSDEYLRLLSKNLSPREALRLQREMAKNRLRVYLPLYREGDYWLRYQDSKNDTVVQSFKSNYERELAWKEAQANGAQPNSNQNFSRIEDLFSGGGPGTFFNRVLEDLKSRGAPEAVKRSLYELYLDQIPASSVRQLYRKRDGYKGYESDLMNVYSTVATRMANQLINLEYIPEIDKVFNDVKEEAKQYAASGKSKNRAVPLLIDNLNKQMEYLRDPGNGSLVNALSSFSYYWYIIGNISTAIINITQLPMVVYPMLAGKYGIDKASTAMADATSQYFKGGFDNDNVPGGVKKFPADFSFGVGVPPNSPLGRLYKAAVRQSAIRRSTGYDVIQGRKKSYGMDDYVGLKAKLEQILGWTFQNSERFNREVTLIAAFNLEMQNNGGNVDGAIKAAIDLVNMTHGTVLAETSPRVFQTGFGKVAGTFKNFAQTQVYLQSKLLRDALKGETPEVKQLAAKQMIGIMTMAFIFAGLHGLPFYSAGTLLADLLADMFGDDDDPLKSDEVVRQSVGALAHKGVVNELLMVDFANRTGFNGLLWRDDDKRLEEVGPVLFAAEQLFGPAYAGFMSFFRGYEDYKDGHYDRALEAITPSFIRNNLKAYRYAVEGAKSRSGEKIYDDFNNYELFMQTVGFTPTEVSRRTEVAGALASRMDALNKRKTALLDRFYLAKMNKDKEGEREAREAIKQFNQNEFVKKTRNIIANDMLNESFDRRRKNTRNSIYGINVPEKSRRQLEAEYKLKEDL